MKENLNKYINTKQNELKNSSFDFESLFNIIHNQDDRIFAEYIESFRVKEITYKEFKEYCYKFATYLSNKIDEPKNSYIGILMENSLTWVATFWALLMLGYNPLLLNCKLPISFNEEIANTMRVNTIISSNDTLEINKKIIKIDSTNSFNKDVVALKPYAPTSFANEIALSTTATSLNYKICVYTGKELTYQALNAKGIIAKNNWMKRPYKGSIKMLCFLPFYHIFGLVASYFWFSIFGRKFVFLNDYSSQTILKTIQRHDVTHIFAVPLLWNTIAREIQKEVNLLSEKEKNKFNKGIKLSLAIQNIFPLLGMKIARKLFERVTSQTLGNSISFLISGGGYISSKTLNIINGIGYPLFNGYGSTEVGISSVELRKKPKYRILGTVGKPFDSITYKEENGELLIKGNSTASKIIYRDGRVEVIDQDYFYNSKDNVVVDNKNYYYISGRNDDVIVASNGEKINPDLIEKNIFLSSINNYSVIDYKNELSFIFEIPTSVNELKLNTIYKEVKQMLVNLENNGTKFTKVYFTNNTMVNKNAIKVSRSLLKRRIENNEIELYDFSTMNDYSKKTKKEISSSILVTIRKIVASILNKEINSNDDNKHFIFELGGTSLDYCTFLLKLKNEFNIDFDLSKQNLSTIEDFGTYIMKKYEEETK